MNRNQIKYIAVIAMIVDHISAFFVPITNPIGLIMRIIGRLTAPIMCFFLAEGFRYTSSRKKYGIRLFVFAVVSQFAYAFAHGISLLTPSFNMIFTLFLCFLILQAYEKIENSVLKAVVIFILIAFSLFSDWGIVAPLWVMSFYILHKDTNYNIFVFSLISIIHIVISTAYTISSGYSWYSQMWQLGVFMFIPFLFFYNRQGGKKNIFTKWLFYIVYPLHLSFIGLIDVAF